MFNCLYFCGKCSYTLDCVIIAHEFTYLMIHDTRTMPTKNDT